MLERTEQGRLWGDECAQTITHTHTHTRLQSHTWTERQRDHDRERKRQYAHAREREEGREGERAREKRETDRDTEREREKVGSTIRCPDQLWGIWVSRHFEELQGQLEAAVEAAAQPLDFLPDLPVILRATDQQRNGSWAQVGYSNFRDGPYQSCIDNNVGPAMVSIRDGSVMISM